MVVTPGYRIVLRAGERTAEYYSSKQDVIPCEGAVGGGAGAPPGRWWRRW